MMGRVCVCVCVWCGGWIRGMVLMWVRGGVRDGCGSSRKGFNKYLIAGFLCRNLSKLFSFGICRHSFVN